MDKYNNAFTEVYEILNCLEEEELSKIPEDILKTIKENRNFNYIYKIDTTVLLKEQTMLPETKAILFNLFRDYLSTLEQKEKIIKMQHQERIKNEEYKKKQYNSSIFEDKTNESIKEDLDTNVKIVEYKENLITKFLKNIKKIFKRK